MEQIESTIPINIETLSSTNIPEQERNKIKAQTPSIVQITPLSKLDQLDSQNPPVSNSEAFLGNNTFDPPEDQEKFYKSAFQEADPNGPNETLTLNLTSHFMIKERTESSAWLDMKDLLDIRGKDQFSILDKNKEKNEKNAIIEMPHENSIPSLGGISQKNQQLSDFINTNPHQESRRPSKEITHSLQIKSQLNDEARKTIQFLIKSALVRLKDWEDKRVKVINNHRIICEHLFEALTDRILVAKQQLNKLYMFFMTRINAERALVKSLLSAPKLEFCCQSIEDEEAFSALPKGLKEVDDIHLKHIEKSRIISNFIEDEIIKNILDKDVKRFREEVDNLINQFKKARNALTQENYVTTKITNEYVSLYKKSINFENKKKDLFVFETQFLSQARKQTQAQKELGLLTIVLVREIRNWETQRIESFIQAMKLYTQSMSQLYGDQKGNLVLGTFSNIKVEDEINNSLSLKKLLKEKDLKFLSEQFAIVSEITFNEVNVYLRSMSFQNIETNPLILYEFQASIEENGLLLASKSLNFVLSVDRNIIVYDINQENLEYKIYRVLKFSQITLKQIKEASNTIEFIEAKRKLLLGSNLYHINITFRNRDDKNIFLEIYQKFNF